MSKFTFTDQERAELKKEIESRIFTGPDDSQHIGTAGLFEIIEQIVSERDGWIGIEVTPDSKWYIACTDRPIDHPRKVIEAFYDAAGIWLDVTGDLPDEEHITHYMEKPLPPKPTRP